MWPFNRSEKYITEKYLKDNYVEKKELTQTIRNVVREAVIAAYQDHNGFWTSYNVDMYSIAKTAMNESAKEASKQVINTEEFLDEIIDRIKRKQL